MLTGPVAVLVRARPRTIVPNHLLSTDPADVPGDITDGDPDVVDDAARPDDDRAAGRGAARSSASSAATCRARAGRSTSTTARCAAIPLPVGPARERPAAGADLHAGHEGADGRARREHPVRERRDADRAGAGGRGSATTSLALYRHGAEVCERAGIILADTKFEFGLLPSGELLLIDEVMTPDSSPLLGRRDLPARPGRRRASTSSTSATGSSRQDWDRTRARARRSRSTSSPGRAPATSPRSSGSPAPASTAISQEDVIAR